MKKVLKKSFYLVMGCLMLLTTGLVVNATVNSDWANRNNIKPYHQIDTEMRAVWVATVYNLDIGKQKNNTEEGINEWKNGYLSILDRAQEYNLNTIIFQIRPCNDAFYPSKYNPWSEYLFEYGKDPGWDPLAWMIEVTHARGMQYHAWMNPYRVTVSASESITQKSGSLNVVYDYDNDALQKAKHAYFEAKERQVGPAKDGGDFDNPIFETGTALEHDVVLGTESKYVLNPASPNTIEHLVNTITEVIDNYEIDGIHFDDYFYPDDCSYIASGTNANFKGLTFSTESITDYQDYTNYKNGGGSLSIYDWRRENVNNLIQTLSELIRNKNNTKTIPCAFGISPAARWAPSIEACGVGNPRGAEGGMDGSCNNYYSYSDLYADTKKWVDEEWLDYILPQDYASLSSSYTEIIDWWSKAMQDSPVKLYVGTPLYQVKEWQKRDEIYYQIRYNQSRENRVSGYCLYDYSSMTLKDNEGTVAMNYVKTFCWKTNALTPIYDKYQYKHTVTSNAKETSIVETGNNILTLSYNQVEDAKAYILYKIDNKEDIVNEAIDPTKMLQMNFKNKNEFVIENYDETKLYYLATVSDDNTIYLNDEPIDFSITKTNNHPKIKILTDLSDEYLIDKTIEIKAEITDEDENDTLTCKVVVIYNGSESNISQFSFENNILTFTWQTFLVAMDNIQFKITASDGKATTEVLTKTFNIIEKCEHDWIEATCDSPKTCKICGETDGDALGHDWIDASCNLPKRCARCGKTEGEALGHDYQNGNCTRCGATDPNYQAPKKGCNSCKKNHIMLIISLITIFTSLGLIVRKKH